MVTISNKPTDSKETVSGSIRVNKNVSINCDQVAWLLDIADRYLPKDGMAPISRQRDMKKYGMLYEIMEIAGLKFEDDRARWNGTPNEARPYNDED